MAFSRTTACWALSLTVVVVSACVHYEAISPKEGSRNRRRPYIIQYPGDHSSHFSSFPFLFFIFLPPLQLRRPGDWERDRGGDGGSYPCPWTTSSSGGPAQQINIISISSSILLNRRDGHTYHFDCLIWCSTKESKQQLKATAEVSRPSAKFEWGMTKLVVIKP